jgi:hypothetical protein
MDKGIVTCFLLATALTFGSAVRAEPPRIPLVHATAATTFCARGFPAIPGSQTCIDLAFRDFDLWVFRGSSATATIAYESAGLYDADVPPTPLTARPVSGSLTPPELTELRDLLAESRIGSAAGHCNPIPPLAAVPSTFPQPKARFTLVWFGKGFRSNVVELGAQFPDLCPQVFQDLYTYFVALSSRLGGNP